MLQVSLDTSFLISFADPSRAHHAVALEYFRHCLTASIPMWMSVIAAGEFAIKQPVTDLPLQNFRVQPYNLPHAVKGAELYNRLQQHAGGRGGDARTVIINDLKIIAQAEEEQIPVILTEDENTLSRIVARLRRAAVIHVHCVLLRDGFSPGRLQNPAQEELPLDNPLG
jgi:predicted nucleic acid-binding protein